MAGVDGAEGKMHLRPEPASDTRRSHTCAAGSPRRPQQVTEKLRSQRTLRQRAIAAHHYSTGSTQKLLVGGGVFHQLLPGNGHRDREEVILLALWQKHADEDDTLLLLSSHQSIWKIYCTVHFI